MKKLLLFTAVIFLSVAAFSQSLARITIARDGNVDIISVGLESNVFLYLAKDGSIKKWGYDRFAARGQENYMDELDEYAGRVEYYTANDDIAYRGKIKYIGRYQLSYYGSYEKEELRGKIKSIGTLAIEYYPSFDNESFRGNIKMIGQHGFNWYGSFDNQAYRGKLKSVGPTNLTYYSSFDDKAFSGKIKTLGSSTFTWYSSFDLKDYRGAMKTGQQLQTINTVKYFVRG